MVFESVLTDILNRYLRPYVKRLDTSQMKLGVWKGHACLEKLELKEDLFAEADLNIPLRIKSSYIGKLEMVIPWKKLIKDHVIVTIDEVYIIIGPEFDTEYDPEREAKRLRKDKEKQIEKLEEAAKKRKQKEKESKKGKKKTEKKDTFTEKLIAHLMKNLIVKVRDVHVRYEDSRGGSSTIAAGITLHSLELKSTDANWKPSIARETATLIYKLVELNCLGLYWTTFGSSMASLDKDQMADEMRAAIARPGMQRGEYPPMNEYLLMPMSAAVKLQISLRPGVDLSIPQILVELECEDIFLSVQEKQFKSLMSTIESYDRHATNQRFLKYKPAEPVKADKRAWWVYVITAVVEEDVRRRTQMWSWQHIKRHRTTCKLYQLKYQEKVQSLSPASSLLRELQELEDQLDVFNILLSRRQAKKKTKSKKASTPTLPSSPQPRSPSPLTPPSGTPTPEAAVAEGGGGKALKKEKKGKEKKGKEKKDKGNGFFSNLRRKLNGKDKEVARPADRGKDRGSKGDREASPPMEAVVEISEEEEARRREELYQAIGYSEDEEYVEYPKEYVARKVFVTLNSLTVQLLGKKELGNLVTTQVMASVFQRPSAEAIRVAASVGSMEFTGVPHGPEPTVMVSSHVGDWDGEKPLVDFRLELNPLRRDVDLLVEAELQPIQITYNAETVDGLLGAFKKQNDVHLQELTQAASASWGQLKTRTAAGLQEAMKDRKRMEININLKSPFLVVPEHGAFSKESHLLVVDLGQLSLCGKPKDTKAVLPKIHRSLPSETLSQFYDVFSVRLQGMQVLVAKPGEDWYSAMRKEGVSPLHVLHPTGFEIQLMKSIVAADAYLPSLRIEGALPCFNIEVSDEKLATALKVVTTVEKPPSLVNTTKYYDILPAPPVARPLLTNPDDLADTISIDTMSLASFGEEEEEMEEERSFSKRMYSPPQGEEEEGDTDASRHVFTDVSIKLSIEKIAVRLTQADKPLLDVSVDRVKADVIDRKWDMQGCVSVGNVAILDHMTLDPSGMPTYLLKTENLDDGNFLLTRFVDITRVGHEFARRYTGLEKSVSAQLSLVKINVQRQSLATLLQLAVSMKPAMQKSKPPKDDKEIVSATSINVQDMKGESERQPSKFVFEASFAGIELALSHQDQGVMHADVKGFAIKGKVQDGMTTVWASMEDLEVSDPNPSATTPTIISKADKSKEAISLEVVDYNMMTRDRDRHDMAWVDTYLKAEIQRINVTLDTHFLGNLLEYVKHLQLNTTAIQIAAKATAGTATATATAIMESTKSAFRFKMDVTLHAPLIVVPYRTEATVGEIYIDLGNFRLSNDFVHGSQLMSAMESMSVRVGKATLDCIRIESSSIQIYRKTSQTACSLEDRTACEESHSVILDPLEFTAQVARTLSKPVPALPKLAVQLPLGDVKFHLQSEDIRALLTIALVATRIREILVPPSKQQQPPPQDVCTLESSAPGTSLLSPTTTPVAPGTLLLSPATPTTGPRLLKSGHSSSAEMITELKVCASVKSVSLDLVGPTGPLFKASAFRMEGEVRLYQDRFLAQGSIGSLSVTDLQEGVKFAKILSLAEGMGRDALTKFELMLNLDRGVGQALERPIGEVKVSTGQVQLMLMLPFLLRMLEFIKQLDVKPELVSTATKAAQGGASAVTEYTFSNYKHFKMNISVHAPVLFLPLGDETVQCLMIDLGNLSLRNALKAEPDTAERVAVDEYTISLTSFKVSRVILDETTLAVTAERILLQPFHITLVVRYNVCSWYTRIPTIQLECTMQELKIYLGQDDFEQFYLFGMSTGEKLSALKPKGDGDAQGATVETSGGEAVTETDSQLSDTLTDQPPVEDYTRVSARFTLSEFELRLFQKELPLAPGVKETMVIPSSCALASLQLVGMELSAVVSTKNEVNVKATMLDIALCDEQPQKKDKRTGNRVIQHYTSNPLSAYTGKLDTPIVSIHYILQGDQHSVIINAERLLVLSDMEFMKDIMDYVLPIVTKAKEPSVPPEPESLLDEEDDTGIFLVAPATPIGTTDATAITLPPAEGKIVAIAKALPHIKVDISVKDFRVAIIEDVDTEDPQALALKFSTYLHLKLNGERKQVSLNLADVTVATSSFFDLDNTTSWIVLPFSALVIMEGPLDKPAVSISATVDPICITISPPIVRLVLHAVKTLTPDKEQERCVAPTDLWSPKPLETSKLWYLLPVPLHIAPTGMARAVEEKGETFSVTFESIQIVLESDSTRKSPGTPVLAFSAGAVIQASEFTGELSASADIHCEASYFNEKLAVWEPLLEPVENSRSGRFEPWFVRAEVTRPNPNGDSNTSLSSTNPEAMLSASISATVPLQLTVSTTSLQLFKGLAEAYSKEYGKKVEGSVQVQALTGAPYTVVNKLGEGFVVYVQPGPSLKLGGRKQFAKLLHEDGVDLLPTVDFGRRSYASLIKRVQEESYTMDLCVGKGYKNLKELPIHVPGLFYYTLAPKDGPSGGPQYGVVLEVAVTGLKKTITVRSPILFRNHLRSDVELLAVSPASPQSLAVIKPNKSFSVPLDIAHCNTYHVRPAGYGMDPEGPPISWKYKPGVSYVDFKCRIPEDDNFCHIIRVTHKEEKYKSRRYLPDGEFPHHTFDLYPPLIVQNLLPSLIIIGCMEAGCPNEMVKSGEYIHIHSLDLSMQPKLTVSVTQKEAGSLTGKVVLSRKPSEYTVFTVADPKRAQTELTAHTEELGYLKVGIFSPFWMINKTGLILEYREGLRRARHHPDKEIKLFSTAGEESKIQLGAITRSGSHTEWTRNFTLNAVGTSGCFEAELGEHTYKFGVEIRLSQFTLTKLVIVTPYYLLVNQTEFFLKAWEGNKKGSPTSIPPGELVPFWPLMDRPRMVVTYGDSDEITVRFQYKKADFTVLKLKNEHQAVCVEIQESEAANIITFSPYYPGSVPVQIINHFPDLQLRFWQEAGIPDRNHRDSGSRIIGPRESLFYTWDFPYGRRLLKWEFQGAKVVNGGKGIVVSKDGQESFRVKVSSDPSRSPTANLLVSSSLVATTSISSVSSTSSFSSYSSTPPPIPGVGDTWLAVDESFSESLVTVEQDEDLEVQESFASVSTLAPLGPESMRSSSGGGRGGSKGYWKSFIDGIQRVVIFTPDEGIIDRIKAANSYSQPLIDVSLSLQFVGVSLVDNQKKRELAYISLSQSGLIWQVEKGKRRWKAVSNSLNSLLETAYHNQQMDIRQKDLVVNLEAMEMYSPVRGRLRRTHHDGVFVKFTMSDRDYSLQAKIGNVQVDNQLPFSVYPQVVYPVPPPPTVASTTEPKPFVELSVILRKNQSSVNHFKYFHVLVQKMAVNVDLGFILAILDFIEIDTDPLLETEYVKNDVEYAGKSLKETKLPEVSQNLDASRNFFDVLHIAPIKICLSFNVRSVGRNENRKTVGDRFLQLFLHSLGIILTSVQDADMKFSCFHLNYQPVTGLAIQNLFMKHYKAQALFQLHTLIFGLDVLGNPVSVVRGVVEGTIDLFYEPIKGSVLGPEEFLEGLGIGLKSFVGGTFGGVTGAGAKITGAVGDVFAKLSFDDKFIDKRQQEKTKPPRLGMKLGGFAKNVFEGVTGVVTQPMKGAKKEGAVGLLKGTGRGIVGLIVRPTGGLIDLTSGTLELITKKTQVGDFEIEASRPPRFIGRDGVITPYSISKAVGTAILVSISEGKFANEYCSAHFKYRKDEMIIVTDKKCIWIEKRKFPTPWWKAKHWAWFDRLAGPVTVSSQRVLIEYKGQFKEMLTIPEFVFDSEARAHEVAAAINSSFNRYVDDGRKD